MFEYLKTYRVNLVGVPWFSGLGGIQPMKRWWLQLEKPGTLHCSRGDYPGSKTRNETVILKNWDGTLHLTNIWPWFSGPFSATSFFLTCLIGMVVRPDNHPLKWKYQCCEIVWSAQFWTKNVFQWFHLFSVFHSPTRNDQRSQKSQLIGLFVPATFTLLAKKVYTILKAT